MNSNSKSDMHPCRCRIHLFLLPVVLWSLLIILLIGWGIWQQQYPEMNAGFPLPEWSLVLGLVWLAGLVGFALLIRCVLKMSKTCLELFYNEKDSARRQALFESVVNSLTEIVIMIDAQKKIIMINPIFSKTTGYAFDEVRGRTPEFLFAGEACLPGREDGIDQQVCEIGLKKKNGALVPTETLTALVRDREGEHIGFLLVARDISSRLAERKEKQQLESRLRQSCKMEAIGTLAGGIAHDFNNIIGIITVNTDMALEDIPEANPARINIQRIIQACRRAGNLVQQILAYSRQADNQLIPLMPGSLVKESLQLLRATAPASVRIEHYIHDDFRTIMLDPVQLKQMLVNLYANARHAMADRGTMTVTGRIVDLTAEDPVFEKGVKPGQYFRLSVRDTGTGMDQASRERIFDPFYTTKKVDEGNGMGLAVVKGIVQRHGGLIAVESEPGEGTVFHVYFPVVGPGEEREDFSEEVQSGRERILFVDDENMLIEMAGMFLERFGYRVTEETSSRNALDTFASAPYDFDMVITDQTMAEMNGSDLAVEILKIRPDIPIILLSGYSRELSGEEMKKLGIREFMYKPFDGKTLIKVMRKVLDG